MGQSESVRKGAIGIGVIGILGLCILSKTKPPEIQNEPQQDLQNLKDDDMQSQVNQNPQDSEISYTQINNQERIKEVAKNITVSFLEDSEILQASTIVSVLQNSLLIASHNYREATLKNRKERRQSKKQNKLDEYQKQILQYNEEVEYILQKAQIEILDELNIHKDIFEESMLILMERGYYQQLFMLQASIKQKIKETIPQKKILTSCQVKDLIKYNIQLLNERPEILIRIVQNLRENQEYQQLIPMAMNIILQDFVYEKFGIEEEDQIKNISLEKHTQDSEIQRLLVQIDQAMQDFLTSYDVQDIDGIPEDTDDLE